MSNKIIPAIQGYTEIYCDFCKNLCIWKINYKFEGVITIKQTKINNSLIDYDTCDDCLVELKFLIENFKKG